MASLGASRNLTVVFMEKLLVVSAPVVNRVEGLWKVALGQSCGYG